MADSMALIAHRTSELNSVQSDSLRLLAATALAADNIACLQIDIIGCERAERE